MLNKKRKTLRVFAAAMAMSMTLSVSAFNGSEVLAAPESNINTEAIENYDGEGRLPMGLDASYYRYIPGKAVKNTEIPEAYDLRENHLIGAIRNQNPYGSCWSFGTTASIESNAIKLGAGTGDLVDYSEMFLTWFAYQPYLGEGLILESTLEEDSPMNLGGRREMTMVDTAAWKGPVDETLVPYPDSNQDFTAPSNTLLDQVPDADEVHVQNVDFLPETTIIEKDDEGNEISYLFDENAKIEIQKAIMTHGAVDVSYYAGRNLPGESEDKSIFDFDHHAQYCWQYIPANHEVSIVGWDDHYPAENFVRAPEDEEGNLLDGAWLIRNSWGPGSGDSDSVDEEGYMWISYYDHTITEFSSFQVDVKEEGLFDYDHNYQYDLLGLKSSASKTVSQNELGYSIANCFIAEQDEVLEAVSAVTVDMNSEVAIQIYKLSEGATEPDDGELMLEQHETVTYGGYHTIQLDELIDLDEGERFSVVETIIGENGGYLPIEIGLKKPISEGNGEIHMLATVKRGESYIMNEVAGQKQWIDCFEISETMKNNPEEEAYFGNAMIKAFTTELDHPVQVNLKLESLDHDGNRLGIQEITDLSLPITVPDQTEQIALWWEATDGEMEISVNGESFGQDQEGRAIVLGNEIMVTTQSQPRNNNGETIVLEISKEDPSAPKPTPNQPDPTPPKPSPSTPNPTVESNVNSTPTTIGIEKGNVGTGLTKQPQGPIVVAVILVVVAIVGLGIYISLRKRQR